MSVRHRTRLRAKRGWRARDCGPRGRRATVSAIGLLALVVAGVVPARAQTEPRLAQGVRLAQEGLGDSARTVVERVIAGMQATDTLYPQALYARAVVAANPQDMRRELQRVAVEYASSSWADDALLRLAQLDYATGERDAATRELERLRLDYPASPLFAQASFWAARAYFDLRKPPSACRWLAEGLPRAGNDVELRNQLGFYNQRCAGVALDTAGVGPDSVKVANAATAPAATPAIPSPSDSAGRADSTAREADSAPSPKRPAAPDSQAAARSPAPAFRIQVAAVNTQAAAETIAKRAKTAGFDPVIVTEKGLFKVRVGGYATRAEAQAQLSRVKARLGGTPFVVAQT